jgi:hypothetical protein
LFTNTIQNPKRRPWGYKLGRLTRRSRFYAYGEDSLLSLGEVFRMYGWDQADLSSMSTHDAFDLLGDSMALPTTGVALTALLRIVGESLPQQ